MPGAFGVFDRFNIIGCAIAPMPCGPRLSQPSGSAANFVRQPGEQNQYVLPLCSCDVFGGPGTTVIPQTGSIGSVSTWRFIGEQSPL